MGVAHDGRGTIEWIEYRHPFRSDYPLVAAQRRQRMLALFRPASSRGRHHRQLNVLRRGCQFGSKFETRVSLFSCRIALSCDRGGMLASPTRLRFNAQSGALVQVVGLLRGSVRATLSASGNASITKHKWGSSWLQIGQFNKSCNNWFLGNGGLVPRSRTPFRRPPAAFFRRGRRRPSDR